MNSLDLEIQKIRSASSAIASGVHLIDIPSGPFNLTAHDLRQSEHSLREAADKIANIRIRMERKEAPAKIEPYVPSTYVPDF